MYKIVARSQYGTEVIDTADTLKEAQSLVSEYQMAFGSSFYISIQTSNK